MGFIKSISTAVKNYVTIRDTPGKISFRGIGEAMKNTIDAFQETYLKNKRFWAGLGSSALLHLLILFFGLGMFAKKPEEEKIVLTEVTFYDEKYNPKAARIIQREQKFVPGVRGGEEGVAPLALEEKLRTGQARIKIEKREIGINVGYGNVLRINPNAQTSTEEILSRAPIEIQRGIGGEEGKSFLDLGKYGGGIRIEGTANVEQQREITQQLTQFNVRTERKITKEDTLEKKVARAQVSIEWMGGTKALLPYIQQNIKRFSGYNPRYRDQGIGGAYTILIKVGEGRVSYCNVQGRIPDWSFYISNGIRRYWKFPVDEEGTAKFRIIYAPKRR